MGCAASKEEVAQPLPAMKPLDKSDTAKTIDVTFPDPPAKEEAEAAAKKAEAAVKEETSSKLDVKSLPPPPARTAPAPAPAESIASPKPSFLKKLSSVMSPRSSEKKKSKAEVAAPDATEPDAEYALALSIVDTAIAIAIATVEFDKRRLPDSVYEEMGLIKVGPVTWENAPPPVVEEEKNPFKRFGNWWKKSMDNIFGGNSTAIVEVQPVEPPKPRAPSLHEPPPSMAAKIAFRKMDKNGDGKLSRIEVIKACRADEEIRSMLNIPTAAIRQEDGSRDAFEVIFQAMDSDQSKTIDEAEFVRFFSSPMPLNSPAAELLSLTNQLAEPDATPATEPATKPAAIAQPAISVEPSCTPPTVLKIYAPAKYP